MSVASIAAAIWVSGYGFELVAEGLDNKIFWCRIQYFGKVGLPLAWFVVAAQYCGYDRRLHLLLVRVALVTIPLITLILIWTNDQHHLYHASFELAGPKQSRFLVYKCGAWCGVHLLYCYTLTIAGAAMLVISARQSDRLRRYQAILLLLTAIMPLLASVMDDVGVRFVPYLKLAPVSFAAALAAGFVGIVFLRQTRLIEQQKEEMRDISAGKLTEQALRQRDAELAHILRVNTMGEMATLWAHEVNQPLTAIANYAGTCVDELNRDASDPDELKYALVQIEEQAKRAGRIVNRLKRFVAKTPPSFQELDLNKLISEVCELMRSSIQKHSASLHLDVRDGLPKVRVDATQIQQVIINLLQNALEAVAAVSSDKREISIATSIAEGGVEVALTDCGPGISAEAEVEIFKPYYSTKDGALGMGLNICQRIVQAHGGVLELDSSTTGGAVVKFTLPLAFGSGSC